MPPHPAEVIADVLKLAKEGYSSGQIGMLKGMSRNAVIGVVHRNGGRLQSQTKGCPITKEGSEKRVYKPLAKKVAAVKAAPPAREVPPAIPTIRSTPFPESVTTESQKEALVKHWQRPEAEGFLLADLRDRHCRFPLGATLAPAVYFCGKPRETEQSLSKEPYCPTCRIIAYQPKALMRRKAA